MRITFVLPHAGLAGGVRVVAIYAQRLQARGHEVQILSTPHRFGGRRAKLENLWYRFKLKLQGRKEPSHLNGIDVPHHRLRSPDRLTPQDVPDADVIIATWWETAERLANLPRSKGARAYFIQHYEVHDGQPVDRVKATWRLPMQKIAVAQWLADLARNEFGDPSAIVVPNAVDLSMFFAPVRGKQAAPAVGMMYSPRAYKGCDICIEAWRLARARLPALRLVAFGTGDRETETKLPPEAQYTMLPPQDRLRDLYASCDAWLFGSRSEGFGLPLLEAMACRTPVIATPAGAAPELLAEGGGVLVPHEDPQAMAEAIVRMVSLEEAQWRSLSQSAWQTASRYTWDHATDLFEQALLATIDRTSAAAATDGSMA